MSRSNGLAEMAVKSLVLYRVYSPDDITIEDQLPLIAMCIRATPQIDLQLSPHEVIFGRPMPINAPGETSLAIKFGDNQESWFCHLCRELGRLHDAVKNRKEEIKLEQKAAYDLRHRIQEPTWSVGDLVLVKDTRVTVFK